MATKMKRRCYRLRDNNVGGVERPNDGGSEFLRLTEEEISLQTPTSVMIRIHAVSVNYRDTNIMHGGNPWPVIPHTIPCSDAAGEVISIGPDVTRFKVGDRVNTLIDQACITGRENDRCWLVADAEGVLADYAVFDEQTLVKIPDHLSWQEASLIPVAGLTAWSALGVGEIGIGKTVLIQGTGGVSMMALKIARASGCKVILSSSSDEKLKNLSQLYSSPPLLTVNYRTRPDWHEQVLAMTGGIGVDLVLENGGMGSVVQSMKCTRRGGIVSQVGYLGKQNPDDVKELLPILIDRKINWRGINCGSRFEQEDLHAVIEATEMKFDDLVDKVFRFDQAEEALEYVWKGQQVGKVVIEIT